MSPMTQIVASPTETTVARMHEMVLRKNTVAMAGTKTSAMERATAIPATMPSLRLPKTIAYVTTYNAMAMACNPKILIADEPTTALDVTIQAQIVDLMLQLKEGFGAAVLIITHDLGVVAEIAQRIVVMYAGRVVEEGTTRDIFGDPQHPYTRGLLRSVPKLGERSRKGRKR